MIFSWLALEHVSSHPPMEVQHVDNGSRIKVVGEMAELFGSCPTDEQISNFRPSADVAQRASHLLSLNRTGQMDDELKNELDQYEQAELLMRLVKTRIRARQGSYVRMSEYVPEPGQSTD